MLYYSKQLQNGRWGIFIDNQLVASIGCFDTCEKIIHFLENRLSNPDLTDLRVKKIISPYFHDMRLRP
ncbi:MAG: hypothetical protein ACRC80_21995 [Waterburya sp.]